MTTDIDTPAGVTHLPRRTTDTPDVAELVREHVRNLSDYSRMRYAPLAPFTARCPLATCNAAAGSPCKTDTGADANVFHTPRKRLVASLSNDEKVEAYAALVVTRQLRKKEALARGEELEADPERAAKLAASRRRTGEMWRQIGREVEAAARRCRHVYLHESGCDCRTTGLAKVIPFPGEFGGRPVTHLDDVRGRTVRKPLAPARGGDVA